MKATFEPDDWKAQQIILIKKKSAENQNKKCFLLENQRCFLANDHANYKLVLDNRLQRLK